MPMTIGLSARTERRSTMLWEDIDDWPEEITGKESQP